MGVTDRLLICSRLLQLVEEVGRVEWAVALFLLGRYEGEELMLIWR